MMIAQYMFVILKYNSVKSILWLQEVYRQHYLSFDRQTTFRNTICSEIHNVADGRRTPYDSKIIFFEQLKIKTKLNLKSYVN